MLPDVVMVQVYSKSANVNDLHGFYVDRLPPPPSLHGPVLLLVPMAIPPGGLPCPSETRCMHHPYICPCFGGNINKWITSALCGSHLSVTFAYIIIMLVD